MRAYQRYSKLGLREFREVMQIGFAELCVVFYLFEQRHYIRTIGRVQRAGIPIPGCEYVGGFRWLYHISRDGIRYRPGSIGSDCHVFSG